MKAISFSLWMVIFAAETAINSVSGGHGMGVLVRVAGILTLCSPGTHLIHQACRGGTMRVEIRRAQL